MSRVGGIAARLILASLLLWAGLAKAFDLQGSILSVDAYKILPGGLVRPVAAALPWVEITLGVLLLAGLFVRTVAASVGVLLLVFIGALAQAKARGLQIDCGCFGAGGPGKGVTWLELARDTALLAPIALLLWHPIGPFQLDRWLKVERDDE